LGLAGESLVESRGFKSFADSLLRLKRSQHDLQRALDRLREQLSQQRLNDKAQAALAEAQQRALECQQFLALRLVEMDTFDRRAAHLSHRLYDGALACHMRPFADGVQAFPRMVRDLARTLGIAGGRHRRSWTVDVQPQLLSERAGEIPHHAGEGLHTIGKGPHVAGQRAVVEPMREMCGASVESVHLHQP